MAKRIIDMRAALKEALIKVTVQPKGDIMKYRLRP
jgi:hypothetical protein